MDQIEVAYSTLLNRSPARNAGIDPITSLLAKDGQEHPRIVRYNLYLLLPVEINPNIYLLVWEVTIQLSDSELHSLKSYR